MPPPGPSGVPPGMPGQPPGGPPKPWPEGNFFSIGGMHNSHHEPEVCLSYSFSPQKPWAFLWTSLGFSWGLQSPPCPEHRDCLTVSLH